MIVYHLDGGAKATVRPSGTEPKNKVYIEMPADPLGAHASDAELEAAQAATEERVRALGNAFLRLMLGIVDIELPDFALEISDLVTLENKQHFAYTFVPELEGKLAAGVSEAALSEWIDQELKSYGSDSRLLVTDAFDAYLQGAQDRVDATAIAAARSAFFGD